MALNLRALVVDALKNGLPTGWKVIGHPDVPDRASGRTACVWTTSIKPQPAAPSTYEVTLTVAVLTPHQDARKADDDLDPALFEVLEVLWGVDQLVFDGAERSTYGSTTPAWDITVRTAFTATPED